MGEDGRKIGEGWEKVNSEGGLVRTAHLSKALKDLNAAMMPVLWLVMEFILCRGKLLRSSLKLNTLGMDAMEDREPLLFGAMYLQVKGSTHKTCIHTHTSTYHTHTHTHTHTDKYIHTHAHTCTHNTHVHTRHTHAHVHTTHTHICIHNTHTHAHMTHNTHTHIHIHTHTHTNTHVKTHIQVQVLYTHTYVLETNLLGWEVGSRNCHWTRITPPDISSCCTECTS